MKKLISIILIGWSMAILCCACGKNETIQEETTRVGGNEQNISAESAEVEQENDRTDLFNETEDSVEQQKPDDNAQSAEPKLEEWKGAYLSYIESLEYADAWTYSLIYVDDDEIPELVIDTDVEACGKVILTFHDGILDEWQSSRLNVTYIEKGNLICNSDGNMGYYYDHVYTIQDGKWCYVGGGTWEDGPNGVNVDENGDLINIYEWNEEEISEEEYHARLNGIYPEQQAVSPERYYISHEICSVLRTGDVASAGHRYELLVEDLTWKEAEALCRQKGGYLATITSWEEMERLKEQMVSENKTDITFFVGANDERENGDYLGYHWIEPERGTYYNMLDLFKALWYGFWLEGEPSRTGLTENGMEVDEDYVVVFYRKADGRCYLNDVPDDILSAAPSYSGRVGYICEYDR